MQTRRGGGKRLQRVVFINFSHQNFLKTEESKIPRVTGNEHKFQLRLQILRRMEQDKRCKFREERNVREFVMRLWVQSRVWCATTLFVCLQLFAFLCKNFSMLFLNSCFLFLSHNQFSQDRVWGWKTPVETTTNRSLSARMEMHSDRYLKLNLFFLVPALCWLCFEILWST